MVVTWIVQMNDERESSAYLKSSNSLIAVPGMTGIGASYPLPRVAATGPLSDHRAGGQPAQRERVFMPDFGHCRTSRLNWPSWVNDGHSR
jgi:hypothetical protein